jgi:hypothetical protein
MSAPAPGSGTGCACRAPARPKPSSSRPSATCPTARSPGCACCAPASSPPRNRRSRRRHAGPLNWTERTYHCKPSSATPPAWKPPENVTVAFRIAVGYGGRSMPTVSGCQDELRGSAAGVDMPVRVCLLCADDAAGSARVPDLAVLIASGGLGDDGLGDALPRRKPPTALGPWVICSCSARMAMARTPGAARAPDAVLIAVVVRRAAARLWCGWLRRRCQCGSRGSS